MSYFIYTPEEKQMIQDNLHKIEDYVKENWLPLMKPREYLCADLPGDGYFAIYASEKDPTICYCPKTTSYTFDPSCSDSVYRNWAVVTDIFPQWEDIKMLVNNEIETIKSKRRAILEFSI